LLKLTRSKLNFPFDTKKQVYAAYAGVIFYTTTRATTTTRN